MMPLFHLAIPVDDLASCKKFYQERFACSLGRESESWVDLDFFGHQLVLHRSNTKSSESANPVDGHDVPVPHFGLILEWEQWHELADRLRQFKTQFLIEPYIRFKGEVGEQATLFFHDPAGNAIELKAFKDPTTIFAK